MNVSFILTKGKKKRLQKIRFQKALHKGVNHQGDVKSARPFGCDRTSGHSAVTEPADGGSGRNCQEVPLPGSDSPLSSPGCWLLSELAVIC